MSPVELESFSGLARIEGALGYSFKSKELLLLALTHRSSRLQIKHVLLSEQMNNEQLEFLGDALLGVFVAEELIKNSPSDDEGKLSKKRSNIVDQRSLSEVAIQLGVPELLRLGPGEIEQNSHKKPRVLASAFEAIIAAIYYDAGFEKAREVALRLLKHNIFSAHQVEFDQDFKTQLQELTQKLGLGLPKYIEVATKGPSHQPEFLIALELGGKEVARATGTSKKRAEQQAAQVAFKQLSMK